MWGMWHTVWRGGTDTGPPASCCFCCRFHSFLTGTRGGDVQYTQFRQGDRMGQEGTNRSDVLTRTSGLEVRQLSAG